jgi:predicted glutamine amidotransferase
VWTEENGALKRYRNAEGIRKDQLYSRALKGIASRDFLVHLRRPSLMTTISHRNAQPYVAPGHGLAFAHNGYFQHHDEHRAQFADQLEGTSDSEVGFRYFLTRLTEDSLPDALVKTHQVLQGKANIGVMRAGGEIWFYAGNSDNRAYTFMLDGMRFAATSLHSNDDFLFQTIFPQAASVAQIPRHSAVLVKL